MMWLYQSQRKTPLYFYFCYCNYKLIFTSSTMLQKKNNIVGKNVFFPTQITKMLCNFLIWSYWECVKYESPSGRLIRLHNYLEGKEPLQIIWCNLLLKACLTSCLILTSCLCNETESGIPSTNTTVRCKFLQCRHQKFSCFTQRDGLDI